MSTITASTLRSSTTTLAQQGLKNVAATDQWDKRREVGDQFLRSIIQDGEQEKERVLALVTQNAAAAYLTSRNASKAQVAGLQALAAGVSGPLGVTLAQVAIQALASSDRWDDARSLGNHFTEALSQRAETPLERTLAQVARRASGENLTDQNAFQAQDAAAKMIAAGAAGAPEVALAQLAKSAVDKVNRWDDARTMGYVFLDEIAKHSSCPEKKAVAEAALKASGDHLNHQDGAEVQLEAYQKLLQ